ncbi:MAG: gamma-glutamyl-gamma-aminobutyrate hydrolase family protein [Solobacterium sp.]|nr:gamma-glutamyl-gamma-aminobutyrate hydrolase family protein [Solobacterium sp.]
MKPLIGITPMYYAEYKAIWMINYYIDAMERNGALPVVLPMTADEEEIRAILARIDGIIITGGEDINPEIYGEENRYSGEPVPVRDASDSAWVRIAIEMDKPLLATCRGTQMVNVVCGGTLYQDLHKDIEGNEHNSVADIRWVNAQHNVDLVPGSPIAEVLGTVKIPVNSTHHQAIRKVGEGLEVMAVSEDGITEGVYRPDKKFVWAVQWHPEMLDHTKYPEPDKIFKAFLSSID